MVVACKTFSCILAQVINEDLLLPRVLSRPISIIDCGSLALVFREVLALCRRQPLRSLIFMNFDEALFKQLLFSCLIRQSCRRTCDYPTAHKTCTYFFLNNSFSGVCKVKLPSLTEDNFLKHL